MFTDTADEEAKWSMTEFLSDLDKVLAGEKPITVILDDPAGNSYVQVKYDIQLNQISPTVQLKYM